MKSRAILWLMLIAALLIAGCSTKDVITGGSGLTPSGNQISGNISDQTTGPLTAAKSPYWVNGNLTVPEGQSLTIEPGVELRFDDLSGQRYMFLVKGHLSAVGTADNNIVFTSMSAALGAPDRGQWRALVFDTGSDTSELAYCQIKYGAVWDSTMRYPGHVSDTTGLWENAPGALWVNGAIFLWNSSPIIRKSTILINGYHGIYAIGFQSRPRIIDDNIIENDGDGVRCEDVTGNNGPLKAVPDIWYSNSQENNGRQWAETPTGIGDRVTVNANGDSTDLHYNFTADPMFEDMWAQKYTLSACSPCIRAASDTTAPGAAVGSIPYYIGPTELRGNISGRTISAAQNPWYVTCDVFVLPGGTLNIEPGSLVLFKGVYNMTVSGLLQADGAVFKPQDSTNALAKWTGIIMAPGSDPASYIRNCRLEKISAGTIEPPFDGAIAVRSCAPEISGNTIVNSEYAAISCMNQAQPLIENNTIDGYGPVAINCYNNSHPTIRHNRIHNGVGYSILCAFTSSPAIESNLLYGSQLWSVKCDNGSSPLIRYNTIANNAYGGIIVDNESNPVISENIVAFNYSGSPTNGHGCNFQVSGSSLPVVSYNAFYQPNPNYDLYNGVQPDSTNLVADPLFLNAAAADYHLQAGSPALTAGPGNTQIGAYGLGEW